MTQQQLASAVGIKFQQIQKYESGANRISASRLWDLSKALDVPAAYFFEGAENEHASDTGIPGQLNPSVLEEKETMELVRAYYELEEIPRKRFLELAKALTSEPVKAE